MSQFQPIRANPIKFNCRCNCCLIRLGKKIIIFCSMWRFDVLAAQIDACIDQHQWSWSAEQKEKVVNSFSVSESNYFHILSTFQIPKGRRRRRRQQSRTIAYNRRRKKNRCNSGQYIIINFDIGEAQILCGWPEKRKGDSETNKEIWYTVTKTAKER